MEDIVLSSVPSLSPVVKEELLKFLTDDLGLHDLKQLPYVREDEIVHIVKPLDARILLADWKRYAEVLTSPTTSAVLSDVEHSSLNLSCSSTTPNSTDNDEWTWNFVMPWDKCHPALVEACENKKRPLERHRLEMVRIFVDEILQVTKKPKMGEIEFIARDIVRKYPDSFADCVGGRTIGSGHTTVRTWLFNRITNLQRKPKSPRKASKDAVRASPRKNRKKRPLDEYGCQLWGPKIDEKEMKGLTEKHKWLLEEFSKVDRDVEKIDAYMAETYPLQRKDINGNVTVKDLLCSWPYLFHSKQLIAHYGKLVGKDDAQSSLLNSFRNGSLEIFRVLKNQSDKVDVARCIGRIEAESKLLDSEIPKATGLIDLLTVYFGEPSSNLYMCTKDDCLDDVILSLPCHPYIVTTGNTASNASRFTVFIEKIKVAVFYSMQEAIMYCFCSYYVLNLKYPDKNIVTLEFIQRYFADINVENSKSGKRRRTPVNMKVLKLIRLLNM